MSVAPRWVKLVSCVLLAVVLRPAAAQSLVVYDDALENGFQDFSYTHDAGSIDLASTAQLHSGNQSIAFDSAGFDAVKFASSAVLDTGTYPQFVLWFFGSTAQCNALQVVLEKNAGANDNEVARGDVSAYTTCSSGAGTWKQIIVDFTAAPMNFTGQYDRISLFDNSSGFGTVYFDDVSLQPSIVDPIFSNGFEGGAAAPVNGLVEDGITYDTIASERFKWYDASGNPRIAVLAHNNDKTFAGSHGGELREFVYQVSGSPRTIAAPARDDGGFGYVVSHSAADNCINGFDSSSLGHQYAGTPISVFVGRHHAIYRFTQSYPRYCSTTSPASEHDIPVTIDWVFSTGRDNPLWSVTFDMMAVGMNVLFDDSRAPYGTMNIDGSSGQFMDDNVGGIRWGDEFQFTTPPPTVPPMPPTPAATLSRGWTWTASNTIPFTELWMATTDATMGLVQSQSMARQDAGGGRIPGYYDVSAYWNTTSAAGPACPDGSIDQQTVKTHSLPCVGLWPYQMNSFSYGDISNPVNDAKMTWGTQYGFLGQVSYALNDRTLPNGSTAPGYPRKSYSVFVVFGTKSSNPVDQEISRSAALATVSLGASVGSVVTGGLAGVGRTDSVTYSPAGYDPVYSALRFSASSNKLTATIATGANTLVNPMIIVQNYTGGAYPSSVKLNNITLTMDADYFPSLRASPAELWITLNKSLAGTNTLQIVP